MVELLQALNVLRLHLFHRLLGWVLGLGLYAALVSWIETTMLPHDAVLSGSIHTLMGFLLGVLLVYRTNTANERWWEARKLWGQLVNDLRALALKTRELVVPDRPARERLAALLAGFAFALRDHLRGRARLQEVPGFAEAPEQPVHVPAFLAGRLYGHLKAWRDEGRADGFTWMLLDRNAAGLMDVCGGCERIRNTPIPFSHRISIRQCILLYLLVLPWALEAHYWNLAVEMVAGYFLLGIEQVAHDIEEPFGTHQDDLPLDDLCRGIETSVREILLGDGSP